MKQAILIRFSPLLLSLLVVYFRDFIKVYDILISLFVFLNLYLSYFECKSEINLKFNSLFNFISLICFAFIIFNIRDVSFDLMEILLVFIHSTVLLINYVKFKISRFKIQCALGVVEKKFIWF